MVPSQRSRTVRRSARHRRVRARIRGTADRPRLAVFRSGKHISVQLIDDVAQKTLAHASDGDVKKAVSVPGETARIAVGRAVGLLLAERAKEASIQKAVFDRGGFAYHGIVKAVAEGARKGGLKF